jgi:uncharacterized membrane-anchored protein YitT (DUF2179 family)
VPVEDMVEEVPRVSLIIISFLMMFGVVMLILGQRLMSLGVMGVREGLLVKMRESYGGEGGGRIWFEVVD